jgi:hypothetical protein
MAGHVFISYSHGQDRLYVQRLAAQLLVDGVPAWFDQEIVTGDRWERIIRDQIDTCAAFLVVMTPEAEASDWVAREIARADMQAKPMFPLLLRGEVFFRFSNIQYEDVAGERMPGAPFVANLRRLTSGSDNGPDGGSDPTSTQSPERRAVRPIPPRTSTPGGPKSSVDVQLAPADRDTLLDIVAQVADSRIVTQRRLGQLGFPVEALPAWTADITAKDYWYRILGELDLGRVADPYRRLITSLLRDFPANSALRDLYQRYVAGHTGSLPDTAQDIRQLQEAAGPATPGAYAADSLTPSGSRPSHPRSSRYKRRASWVVPVVVTLIAATATTVALMTPGLLHRNAGAGPTGSAPASSSSRAGPSTGTSYPGASAASQEQTRFMSMTALDGANLDLPESNDTLPDLRLGDHSLQAANGATFAVLVSGQPSTRQACQALDTATRLTELASAELTEGVRLCVRTSAGRLALVQLEQVWLGMDGSLSVITMDVALG